MHQSLLDLSISGTQKVWSYWWYARMDTGRVGCVLPGTEIGSPDGMQHTEGEPKHCTLGWTGGL